MQLTKDKVAILNYTLTDDDGKLIDQSTDGSFAYLHGANNIIPGLEKELETKQAGDKLKVTIEPTEAYGERDLENIQKIPREMFPPDVDIQPNMSFQGRSQQGQPVVVTVTAVEDEHVVVDGNHPLAGVRLHFDLEVVEVREATNEELTHGHVHGPEEHQ